MLLGRLFDTQGRKPMIAFTYIVSGLLLAGTGLLFARDLIGAETQTICWMAIFFFASAAASSAYLTVSETFPLEIRALAIAFFYAIGTGIGGIVGPWLFGRADRHRLAHERVRRLSARRGADGPGRAGRLALGRCRRAQIPGDGGAAADVYRHRLKGAGR